MDAMDAGREIWSDAELVDRWLAQCSRSGSEETRAGYARELQHLRRWMDLHCPGLPLHALDPMTAEDCVRDLRAQVDAGQIRPRTFNRRLAAWSSLFRWASEPNRSGVSGVLRNPWPRRAFLAVTKEAKPLAAPELTGLLGVIQAAASAGMKTAKRDYIMIRGAYMLGCRVSELRSLRWSDVERLDDGGLVTIRRGKGGKSRTIRVSLDTLNLLESLGRSENGEDWLFPSSRRPGAPLSRGAIGDRVARWGRRIGLRVWPHRLRHSHASDAVRVGTDVFVLMATLGHSSSATTQGYVLANPGDSSSLRLG